MRDIAFKQHDPTSIIVTHPRRLKYDTWDDKSGGGRRSKLSVVIENFQFLGGRDDAGSHPGRQRTFADIEARQSPEEAKVPAGDVADDEGFTDADIPF